MEFNSANYLPGIHELSVKAVDSAGNEKITKVQFVTDNCVQRQSDGATVCEYSDPVQEDAETIYPELNATDPPYMIAKLQPEFHCLRLWFHCRNLNNIGCSEEEERR